VKVPVADDVGDNVSDDCPSVALMSGKPPSVGMLRAFTDMRKLLGGFSHVIPPSDEDPERKLGEELWSVNGVAAL
jgi:hypothetical protein